MNAERGARRIRCILGLPHILVLAGVSAGCGSDPPPAAQAEPFVSGFSEGVVLDAPVTTSTGSSGNWVQSLRGTDAESGYTWPDDLPSGNDKSQFFYLVAPDDQLADIIETRLEEVAGPHGTPTRALYQEVKRYHQSAGKPGYARNEYLIRNSRANELQQLYVRQWMRLQDDLEQVLVPGAWRTLLEAKEWPDDKYRIYVNVFHDAQDLRWVVAGQLMADWKIDWRVINSTLPVPAGKWFLFEAYVKQSLEKDGRVRVKVDGQIVADYEGRTAVENPGWRWFTSMKVYTAKEALAAGRAYQWIDDVEYRAQPPDGFLD